MAGKQPFAHPTPTPRQLAYLDELKTRLLLMRERQMTFMEQTAKMLTRISSPNMVGDVVTHPGSHLSTAEGAASLVGVNEGGFDMSKGSKSSLNIKQLIQRFEDLRQNSQKFSELPDVPEELINVDVRRILEGYEKLIEEGNIIQQSWFLLKKSTESCVRFATNAVFKTASIDRPPSKTSSGILEVSYVIPESVPQVVSLPQDEETPSLHSNVATSAELVDKERELFGPEEDAKASFTAGNHGHARWGPFMRVIIRLLKPLHGCTRSKKQPTKTVSSSLIVRQLPKKNKIH